MITEKHCCKCGETKPIGEFYLDKNRPDGHYCYCKKCVRQFGKEIRAKIKQANTDERLAEIQKLIPFKVCIKCGSTKPIQQFKLNRNKRNGYDNICEQCRWDEYKSQVRNMTNKQISEIECRKPFKICNRCGVDKAIQEFPIDRSSPDGHNTLCAICVKERGRERYARVKDKHREYRNNHKAESAIYHKEMAESIKKTVIKHYGNNKCACVLCGESRLPCLSIDHINGGGTKHRRSLNIKGGGGTVFYQWLIDNSYPAGYRTLCLNCQSLVEYEKRQKKFNEKYLTNKK